MSIFPPYKLLGKTDMVHWARAVNGNRCATSADALPSPMKSRRRISHPLRLIARQSIAIRSL